MIARFAPSFQEVAAACFPLPGCSVRGYAFAKGTRYAVTVCPPAGAACPGQYRGTGHTCYEALAAALQLYYKSAHAYPATAAHAALAH